MKTGNNALAVIRDEVLERVEARRDALLRRSDQTQPPIAQSKISYKPSFLLHPHDSSDRRWLGVCLTFSRATRIPVAIVRALFICVGLVTGPLSLLFYQWIYLGQRLALKTPSATSIRGRKLALTIAQALGAVIMMYLGARLSFIAAYQGFKTFTHQELSISALGWLNAYHEWFLIIALLTVLPMAAMSALPLARQWDRTWNTALRASMRVYALVLLVGVVSGGLGLIVQSAAAIVR